MARVGRHAGPSKGDHLVRITRGEVLGTITRQAALRGYHLYQEQRVERVAWTGQTIEAELRAPSCLVELEPSDGPDAVATRCSLCGTPPAPCAHATAALLRWIDIRPTMRRMGPGSIWRSRSRHPFLAPSQVEADRVDLSHLSGADLRSTLELQLSLQREGAATARLSDDAVEVTITLPSGRPRIVSFSVVVLPGALSLLRSVPRLRLEGELAELRLSEARLRPVLISAWESDGVLVEPAYSLDGKTVLPARELADRIAGRWARLGAHLCQVLDPPTPLVPFFRGGVRHLAGADALRFLTLDHPQLRRHPWYLPQGELAELRAPLAPRLEGLEVEACAHDRVALLPRFSAGGAEVPWPDLLDLIDRGFGRFAGKIVRAPDLGLFESTGFRLPRRGASKGLRGDRTAFIRVVAESDLPLTGDDELRRLASILRGETIPALDEPAGLRSSLRPYQKDGLGWLWSRYLTRIGCILADDMGLGKTHQAMALLCLVLERHPDARILVVCPRGVLDHWHDLITTHAPSLEPHLFHGPARTLDEHGEPARVVLTTYEIVLRSIEELAAIDWEAVVFDEAQRLKNPRTKGARAARKLRARFRVALTGTPIENRLLELWSVVDLVLPGYLGSERDFRAAHRHPSPEHLERLRLRLRGLTLRRLKRQVLSDLPDKVEDLRFCALTEQQRGLYRSLHRQEAGPILDSLRDPEAEIPYMHIFALLTRLKQVCDHPSLCPGGSRPSAPAGKLEVLDAILDEALAGDQQVVVFSQYVQMIALLERHLARRDLPTLSLTGATRHRHRLIRRFNSGQHERVLLASLLAGGIGIDLTGASVVVHYDRWWNPAKENQATDRVHRIGQRRFVHVFKLVTRGTIEERIDALIRSKLELLEAVVAPTERVVRALTRDELAELLGVEDPTGPPPGRRTSRRRRGGAS